MRLVGAKQHASSPHIDSALEPDRACTSDSHLASVKRMTSQGYGDLLEERANGKTR